MVGNLDFVVYGVEFFLGFKLYFFVHGVGFWKAKKRILFACGVEFLPAVESYFEIQYCIFIVVSNFVIEC